ncbi:ABC transporter, putative [Bodo saltans]|uniref:ABC transporter, putative n=1 Tax=Bodo saltans TaxID=75058 RepID=A0A0S4J6G3_BODSA|nr:ABC transporter, putative [Bodo saltans]|eukprot:CUG87042.1 ABC transporter, putative [Bodo saltans]
MSHSLLVFAALLQKEEKVNEKHKFMTSPAPAGPQPNVSQRDLINCLITFASRELPLLVAATMCIVLSSAVQLGIPVVAKKLLDGPATAPSSASEEDAPSFAVQNIWFDCSIVIAAILVFHVVSYFGHCFAHNATLRVTHHMMTAGMSALCWAPWETLSHRNPTEWTHLINTASKVVGETCASLITELISSCITAVGISVVVCYLSWELTLFFVLIVASSQMFSYLYARAFHAPSAAQYAEDEGRVSALLCNAAQRSATVRIFSTSAPSFFARKLKDRTMAAFESGSHLNSKIHLHGAVSSGITNSMFVGMIGVCVYMKEQGRLSLVDIGLFFFYMKQLLDRVLSISSEMRRMSTMLAKATEYVMLVKSMDDNTHCDLRERKTPISADSPFVVELRCVTFVYSGSQAVLTNDVFESKGSDEGDQNTIAPTDAVTASPGSKLSDVTMTVRRGEFVCLVGASGCGKSTVLKLIAGLLQPTNGVVRINSTRVALLEQSPSIVLGTVLENIALGNPAASQSDVVAAAKRAGCHDFIAQLPLGYDTLIDNADHAKFSGGQLQRICIARVFMTSCDIILMDEPTTGLDATAAASVLDSAVTLNRQGTTVIFASHDAAVIRRADRVIHFGGSHAQELDHA